jgi:hypothetical protein
VGAEEVWCRGVAGICSDGDVQRGKDGGQTDDGDIESFVVEVGLHQGSVLSHYYS